MKRIVLIETQSSHIHVYSDVPIPRLGTVLLGTILRDHGYEVKVYIEDIAPVEWEEVKRADLVGISLLSSTAPHSYQLADQIRSDGIPVVLGGTHVTFEPDEGLDHADYLLRGEADDSFLELIEALRSGADPSEIIGLSYWREGKKVHNPNRSLPLDLDKNPVPDFRLVHGIDRMKVVTVSTSRGCPFDCSFCSVTAFNGRQYRTLSVERVIQEVEQHMRHHQVHYLFFADDIFNFNRKRTKEIITSMIEHKLTPRWGAQFRHEAARDPELLDLMRRSNCDRAYVGFESINPKTLEAYNKKESVQNIIDTIHAFHNNHVKVHGMFVLGSDADDVETIRATTKFAKHHDIDSIQVMVLTPIPGSRDYNQFKEQNRELLTKDWSLYDGHHVVHIPKILTPYELQLETHLAMKEFYSLKRVIPRLLRGDWFECALRLCGHRLIKNWYKENKDYIQNLRTHLLRNSAALSRISWTGFLQQRIAVAATENNRQYLQVLETFFEELGVQVVRSTDSLSGFLEEKQEILAKSGRQATDKLTHWLESLRGEVDIVFMPLKEEIGNYSGKIGQSIDGLSKSIRTGVKRLPQIVHVPMWDFTTIRQTLTGIGLLITDDLSKISRACGKAISNSS